MIYFIQAEVGGPVKIGLTAADDIGPRFKSIQACSPFKLQVLATIAGARPMEQELHRHFAHLRLHGEWFTPGEDLVKFIHDTASRCASVVTDRPGPLHKPIGPRDLPAGPLPRRLHDVFEVLTAEWTPLNEIARAAGCSSQDARMPLLRLVKLGRALQGRALRRDHYDGMISWWRRSPQAVSAWPQEFGSPTQPTYEYQQKRLARAIAA